MRLTLTNPVLIEPLWNWNVTQQTGDSTTSGLNRTFVELKLGSVFAENEAYYGLNRTFVELKLMYVGNRVIILKS